MASEQMCASGAAFADCRCAPESGIIDPMFVQMRQRIGSDSELPRKS